MEIESQTLTIELPTSDVEEAEPKVTSKKKKTGGSKEKKQPTEPQPPKLSKSQQMLLERKVIVQVPETLPAELLEHVKENLDKAVELLHLDTSEIRMMKPEQKVVRKFVTAEDRKEHYRKYNKEYYHKNLTKEGKCPHCDKTFKTCTSIARHVKYSKNCLALQAQKQKLEEGFQGKLQEQQAKGEEKTEKEI